MNRPSHRSGDNSEHGTDTIWQVSSEGESGASIAVAEFMGRVGKQRITVVRSSCEGSPACPMETRIKAGVRLGVHSVVTR